MEKYIRSLPVKMVIGGLTGLLYVGASFALLGGILPGLFGGSTNFFWFFLSLLLFFIGPFIIGLMNTSWSRALYAGIVAPFTGLAASVFGEILLAGLDKSLDRYPRLRLWDLGVLLSGFSIAAIICTTEKLTRKPDKGLFKTIIRGFFLAVFIVFGFELLRNYVANATSPGLFELERGKDAVLPIYAFLTGVNATYFGNTGQFGYNNSLIPKVMVVCINILGLVIPIALMFGL